MSTWSIFANFKKIRPKFIVCQKMAKFEQLKDKLVVILKV